MRIYSLILLTLLPTLGFGQQWKNFTDTAGHFTAQYPSDWVNKIKTNNRVFFTSPANGDADMFLENINISVSPQEDLTDTKISESLSSIVDVLKEQLTGFSEESRRTFKWNGAEAAELIYTGYASKEATLKIRSTQWFCYYKSSMFIVTFVAAADNSTHNNTAKKIMNSIVFK
jgi:hypothetical protein